MLFALLFPALVAFGASKPHVIAFGKWTTIKWCAGVHEAECLDLKMRALYVDGRARESTLGAAHDITERLFVVRRAFRVNDNLPGDAVATHWVWQRGGWLLVDRMTGRVSSITLPEFDPYYSVVSWYRDYAAYCGVSDDGKKLFAVVFQIGRRKPVMKKALGEAGGDAAPDSECPAPGWERRPVRVTFEPDETRKSTYTVRGHAADLVSDEEQEEEKAAQ
jgi:hypothetical protein